MKRREFMVAASGVSGGAVAATAATPVAAQEDENGDDTEPNGDDADNGDNGDNGDEEANGNGNGAAAGGGGTEVVEVGDNYYEPDELTIEPGTTVVWEWVGQADHNVAPSEQPDGADWEGHPDLKAEGDYEFTFTEEGTYDYVCSPHVGVGMVATVEVTSDADEAAGVADVDIDELGIPIQKHFVGIASFLAIFVSFVFTFYLLKYGESTHTSSPGRK